jgi:ABC-type bacteriocin/lantibiotic exporter with double-glycine peptidase domain
MKFFGQEKEYTCGCACVRMAISHFTNDIPTENELEIILGTNNKTGTNFNKVIEYFQSLNYDVISENNSNIKRVRELHKNGYVILMAISIDVPHFTVYNGDNNNSIYFFDPYFGEISRQLKSFMSDYTPFPLYRWRVKAKEFIKYYPDVDFSEDESNKFFIAVKLK